MIPRPFIAAGAAVTAVLVQADSALAARTYGENTPLHLSEPKHVEGATGGGGGSLVRTFVGLAIVLGVIYGLYWVLRQVKASKEERASGNGLSTIATLPLGPNRSLHMVKSGREVVLIGVAEHGVTPIRSWSEAEAESAGFFDQDDQQGIGALDAPAPARRAKRPGFPTIGEFIEDLRQRTVRK